MPVTTMTSRQLDRNPSRVFEAARQAPVYITTRGRTTHVMITFEEYCRLTGSDPEALASEVGEGSRA
jgi:PHD/YefM family antitoxin component YafN of YafNO toxin-antitoxin module